jgi:chemotaxis protein CheD
MSLVASDIGTTKSVGMGQILLGCKPTTLTAVLGSCVGVALYHPRRQVGVLAHVVLADSAGRSALPGKFADTAIPHMVELLAREGIQPSAVVAKIAGGACMFGAGGPMQIGDANVEAVLRGLTKAGIRVAGKDVGGTKGRRVALNCSDGTLEIENIGCVSRTL